MITFNRKAKENASKVVDESMVLVNDFRRPLPFWSYRPVPYKSYAPLDTLGPVLDDYLDKLFSGEIDEGNADCLDNIIYDVANQALDNLADQRTRHVDLIRNLYFNHVGLIKSFEAHLESLCRKKEAVYDEYQNVSLRYKNQKYKEEI